MRIGFFLSKNYLVSPITFITSHSSFILFFHSKTAINLPATQAISRALPNFEVRLICLYSPPFGWLLMTDIERVKPWTRTDYM